MYCTKVRVQYVYNGPYDCPAWLRKYGSTDVLSKVPSKVCSMYQRTKVRKYFRTTYVRKYSIYTIILYSNMIPSYIIFINTFVRMKVVQLNYLPSEGTFKDNKIQKYVVLSYGSTSVLPHLDLFPYTCRATTT